jgi:hypothetical protein
MGTFSITISLRLGLYLLQGSVFSWMALYFGETVSPAFFHSLQELYLKAGTGGRGGALYPMQSEPLNQRVLNDL